MCLMRFPLFYDALLLPFEYLLLGNWRRLLWQQVEGRYVLEVGAGTGINIPYYGSSQQVTLLEKNERFLEKARRRIRKKEAQVKLVLGDVENLPFSEQSFDVAVATFLFCSVENPEQGLKEIFRVLKPGGLLLLLEHVRSEKKLLGRFMELLSLPLYKLAGENIARETEKLVQEAGFVEETVHYLLHDVVRFVKARKVAVDSEG